MQSVFLQGCQHEFVNACQESRQSDAGNKTLSSDGGLAIAIPLELKGLWTAHQRSVLLAVCK